MDCSSGIETLDDFCLSKIFKFLTLKEIAICSSVNRSFKLLMESPCIWRRVQFDFFEKDINDKRKNVEWFVSKIYKFPEIKQLILNDTNGYLKPNEFVKIFAKPLPSLEFLELSMPLINDTESTYICLLMVKQCPNLKAFYSYGHFLTDAHMEFFSLLPHLEDLRLMYNSTGFEGSNLKACPPLSKIYLRPYTIEFNNLMEIVKKSQQKLTQLAIDTEQMEEDQAIFLLNFLDNSRLEYLLLSYCESFGDKVFSLLSKFEKLTHLKFYKANEVTSEAYISCFSRFSSQNLVELNLKECNELTDEGLIAILSKSKKLGTLKLAWQRHIGSPSILFLFQNCPEISKVILQGIKQLDISGFPEISNLMNYFNKDKYHKLKKDNSYIDENNYDCIDNNAYDRVKPSDYFNNYVFKQTLSYYKKLRLLDCTKSDHVPDEALQIIHILNPHITALNYYGEKM